MIARDLKRFGFGFIWNVECGKPVVFHNKNMLASEFHDSGGVGEPGEPHEPFGNEVELVFSTAHQLRTSSFSKGLQLVGKS